MSPHEPSNDESTHSFRQRGYIILALFHGCFAIGFAIIFALLVPIHSEFINQNRSEDTDYAIVALFAMMTAVAGHGIMFFASLYKMYKFQPRSSINPFVGLVFIFGIVMLGFDSVLVYQFPKWHGQFKAAGDSRSAQYCTSATVLFAVHIPCAILCCLYFLYQHYYYLDVNAHEAPVVRESGETDNGENGERRLRR